MNSIAIGDKPETISKYVATVTPQGKGVWTLAIEDVKYFSADPSVVYSTSLMMKVESFSGTEEEACAQVCEKMKKFVEDRDAVVAGKPITITEDDLV